MKRVFLVLAAALAISCALAIEGRIAVGDETTRATPCPGAP